MQTTVAQALAEAFWNGWIPSDLADDLIQALEFSSMGPGAFEQVRELVSDWEARAIDTEALVAQCTSLHESFAAAAEQAEGVVEPGNEALIYLLHAMQEALRAMSEACAGVAASALAMHGGALRQAMLSAEEASAVMQEIYDGTHYEGG